MFLLIDVLVLLLLFWGYSLFFNTSQNKLEKDGFVFSLYAYGSPKSVLVSLILRLEKKSPLVNEGESIPVVFRMGGKQWEGSLQIPGKEGSEQVVRLSIPEPVGKEVIASFFWKGKSYTLKTPIR